MSKTYKKWTQSDIDFILNHQNLLDKDVAEKLSTLTGQPVSAAMIRRQRRKSGVSKSRGRPRKNSNVSDAVESNGAI